MRETRQRDSEMPVKVPRRVWEAILYLRQSLQLDMHDAMRVSEACASRGLYEAADWILENQDEYLKLLTEGPETTD